MQPLLLWDGGDLDVVAEAVQGHPIQGEDTLGQGIDFQQQIVVDLFKFQVQLEELVAADVPVETTDVHVEDLVAGQQVVQLGGQGL